MSPEPGKSRSSDQIADKDTFQELIEVEVREGEKIPTT